ncbi:hypothetical protein BKA93DRAFT_748035 [Sparassis latifolia]
MSAPGSDTVAGDIHIRTGVSDERRILAGYTRIRLGGWPVLRKIVGAEDAPVRCCTRRLRSFTSCYRAPKIIEVVYLRLYQGTSITLSIRYLFGSRDALVSTSSVSALATSSSTSKMCVWPMQGHLQLASSGFEDIDVPHAVLADIVQVYFDPAAGEQAVTIPQGVFQVNGRDMMIILVPRESKTMTLYAHSVPNHTISPISCSLLHHIDEEQHQSKLQAYSQLLQQGFLIPHQSCMDRSDAKLEASREGTPETGVVMPMLDDREYGETAGLEGGTIPVTPGGARYELVGDDDAALCAGPEAGPVGIKVGAAQFAMPWNPGMALRDCGPDSCCENAGGYDAGGYY